MNLYWFNIFSYSKFFFRTRCLQIVFLLLTTAYPSTAQVSVDSSFYTIITEAITTSNAELLSHIVNNKVDIILPEQSGVYSKNQSRFILQNFFEQNTPESFQLVTKSKLNNSSYFVGKLHTSQKQYRVCFLTKENNSKLLIYQIRIEE